MKPEAPGLSSTTTGCLVMRVTSLPSARASWSVALPAANGHHEGDGLSGYSACADAAPSASRTPASNACHCSFMSILSDPNRGDDHIKTKIGRYDRSSMLPIWPSSAADEKTSRDLYAVFCALP